MEWPKVPPVPRPVGTDGTHASPVEIKPRVNIRSIEDVDMKSQTFDMDVQMELAWHDPDLASRMDERWEREAKKRGWQDLMRETCWHPGLVLDNCRALTYVEFWYRFNREHSMVFFIIRVKGTFRERFELQRFPFDVQWLSLRTSSTFPYVRFLPGAPADFVDLEGFILEEYILSPHVCVQARPSNGLKSSSGTVYHELNLKVRLDGNVP